MKFIAMADWHLLLEKPRARLDDAHKTQKDKVFHVFRRALSLGAPVIVAGDVFDKPRSWLLLSAWWPVLKEFVAKVNVYAVFGQHDTYFYNKERRSATSLGVLDQAGMVTLLNHNPVELDGVRLYGINYGEKVDFDNDKLWGDDYTNILAIHDMIVPRRLWTGQEGAIYAPEFINKNHGFDLVVAGDCHRKFMYRSVKGKRYIVNSGPILRKTADQYNFEYAPGFWIYDTDNRTVEFEEIPFEPADRVLSREHIEEQDEANRKLEAFIGAIKSGDFQVGTSFISNLNEFLKQNDVEPEVRKLISDVVEEDLE